MITIRRIRYAAFAIAVSLGGCAAVNITRPPESPSAALRAPSSEVRHVALKMTGQQGLGWESFKTEWQEAVGNQARGAGMTFESVDAAAQPTAVAGVLLDVRVIDYHYVSPAARFMVGILTGNASFDARIKFVDIATGAGLGEKFYSTTSSAWDGIMAGMTDRQARAVAVEVMRDLRSARPGAPMLSAAPAASASGPSAIKAEAPKGTDLFIAERLAKAQACHRDPHAVLTAKGPGFESYSVACENGDALAMRCEFGNCRVLR